ncbi:MAG: WD40/YVTN/BNR-like repeat-containing protein [Bryobacteraceae bacterium]
MAVDYHCGEDDIRAAGLSCTIDDPCPVFLELDAVETVGNRIFVAGNIHSSSTTFASVLLSSDDAGQTWREPHERIHLAGLDRIQFIDYQNGWAAGEVQHPLPRDPFLLATTDGGKTWEAKPIFADPQFGAVLQFWFTSRTNGNLVIDRGRNGESGRYELYETSNAGDTWRLHQTSERPIDLAHASSNTDWRLRADRASKSYRIERRTAGAWKTVAAFSISAGSCKPPEPLPAPPESGAAGVGSYEFLKN